jgi:divalent metal cation (Fe/Co/Zn/Cd) transporter
MSVTFADPYRLVPLVGGAYLGVPWLDPVAGMLLAGMIVKAGFDISTNR